MNKPAISLALLADLLFPTAGVAAGLAGGIGNQLGDAVGQVDLRILNSDLDFVVDLTD